MAAFRTMVFLTLAFSAIGLGAFIGGAIAQPALLSLVPWYHGGGQKI